MVPRYGNKNHITLIEDCNVGCSLLNLTAGHTSFTSKFTPCLFTSRNSAFVRALWWVAKELIALAKGAILDCRSRACLYSRIITSFSTHHKKACMSIFSNNNFFFNSPHSKHFHSGFVITEENVLPLKLHPQLARLSKSSRIRTTNRRPRFVTLVHKLCHIRRSHTLF